MDSQAFSEDESHQAFASRLNVGQTSNLSGYTSQEETTTAHTDDDRHHTAMKDHVTEGDRVESSSLSDEGEHGPQQGPGYSSDGLPHPADRAGASKATSILQRACQRVFLQLRRWLSPMRTTFQSFRRNPDEVFSSNLRPTNRLILLVVIMSFVMALAVAGTAVGLQWQSSTESRKEALRTELDLTTRAVGSFVSTKRAVENQQIAATIATRTIYEAGYDSNVQITAETQRKSSQVISLLLDNLFQETALDKVTLLATLFGTVSDHLCALGHCDLVPGLFSAINAAHGTSLGLNLILANLTQAAAQLSTSIAILSDGGGCQNKTSSCLPNVTRNAVEKAVLEKASGSSFSLTSPVVGYTYASKSNLGIAFGFSAAQLQSNFLNQTVRSLDRVNSVVDGTIEVMIQTTANPGYPLTTLRFPTECSGSCKRDEAGARATLGEAYAIDVDYRHTSPIIATASPLGVLRGYAFVFEVDLAEVVGSILSNLRDVCMNIDALLPGSQKLLLGRRVFNKTTSTYTYALLDGDVRCNTTRCRVDDALQLASAQCKKGSGPKMKDFRGVDVIAAYDCIPELDLVVGLEIDVNEIVLDSVNEVVEFANTENAVERDSSIELMIVDQYDPDQPTVVLTTPKSNVAIPNSVSNASIVKWAQQFGPFGEVMKGRTGISAAKDYRGADVLAAYDYSPELSIGFILKLDVSDFQRPLVTQLLILLGTAIGIAIFGVFCVGVFARQMLSSIETTWEKGKKAVQEQKESFELLVGAMYPKFATEKLLAGEVQIVLEVQATVFFSDICNFTSLSNRLTAAAMIEWIGYLFGVMDTVAEFHKIYKVKTIGDAYFAISGPPSLVEGVESSGHAMRMIRFAADCAQIFSGNFTHPDAGSCLKMIAAHSAILKREKRQQAAALANARRLSGTTCSTVSGFSTESTGGGSQGQCVMRYGIASGPVTMGVLQGKRPMFDVWGKTVNLAARMENAGQPAMIQCSESTYSIVTAEAQTEFIFDEARVVFAKGFGNVPAYFIKDGLLPPARVLLDSLALEPAYGAYSFTNQVYRRAGGGGQPTSNQPRQQLQAQGSMGKRLFLSATQSQRNNNNTGNQRGLEETGDLSQNMFGGDATTPKAATSRTVDPADVVEIIQLAIP